MYPRNSLTWILLFCLISVSNAELTAQQLSNPHSSGLTKGPPNRFTGDVWVDYLVNDSTGDFLVSKVFFEPGARSNWHHHLGRQIILAIDGVGYYKERGKPMRRLKKGDVVVIEPGTVHSHGSINSARFTQVVMMNDIGRKDATTWLNKVTEEEIKE